MWMHEYRKFLFYPLHHEVERQIPEQVTLGDTTLVWVLQVRVVWMISRAREDAEWELSEISVSGNTEDDPVTRTLEIMRSHDSRIKIERPDWLSVLVDQCRPEEQLVG
jgi:hypothetical protein